MKKYLLIIILSIILTGPVFGQIGVIFYGKSFDPYLLQQIQKWTRITYHREAYFMGHVRLPQHAYYPPRHRYLADRLLFDMQRFKRYEKIIAITDVDISTGQPNWGILGLSTLGGKYAVASTYRSRNTAYFLGTVIHELGHTYGMNHCTSPICFMEKFVRLRKYYKFCVLHNQQLRRIRLNLQN